MDWNDVSVDWTHFRTRVREQWSKLTDVHLDFVAGNRERLVGRIRQVYGISQEQTEKQVSAWLKRVPHRSNGK
jgi:uncharacterized protein YjbJ (UPF0337 family)